MVYAAVSDGSAAENAASREALKRGHGLRIRSEMTKKVEAYRATLGARDRS
jgi:hypothetical protein